MLSFLILQDPAIQQVTRTSRHAENSLEDYNPFEHEQANNAHAKLHSGYNPGVGGSMGAAIVQPQLENIVPASGGGVPLAAQVRNTTMTGIGVTPLAGANVAAAAHQNTTINITTAELQVR